MANNKIELTYRLPVTTVTVDGTRTTVTNQYTTPTKAVVYSSQVVTQIEADPKTLHVLQLPDPDHSTTSCTVEVAHDGRLTSTQAGVDDKSQDRIRALLKVGLTTAGTLAPLAAAALFAPAGLPTAGAMALAGLGLPLGREDSEAPTRLAVDQESDEPLRVTGVEEGYREADENAAMLLANLRWSDIMVRAAIASAGHEYIGDPKALATRLKALTKAQEEMRAELARAEAAYAKWIAGNATTQVESFHYAFRLGELPSTAKLRSMASGGRGDGETPSWWRLLTQLQCAVTCDFEDKDPEELNPDVPLGPAESPEVVVYRIPRLATITHWAAKPTTGNDTEDDSTWELTEVLRERRKVVIVQGTESYIPLRPMQTRTIGRDKPAGDSDTGLTFDADGILSKVTTERTDPSLERAATLAELPDDIKNGISAGRALLKPFTPEGETERLKAQTDLINARKALKKAKAPSPDDPLADLKADVEESELQARRARAHAIVSDPTRSLVVVTVTPEIDDSGNEV